MGILAFLFNKIAMWEIFNCTKDKPLHLLMSGLNQFEIEELKGIMKKNMCLLMTLMKRNTKKYGRISSVSRSLIQWIYKIYMPNEFSQNRTLGLYFSISVQGFLFQILF